MSSFVCRPGVFRVYFLLVTMAATCFLDSSLAFDVEYKSWNKEELIHQQCKSLPPSRRLLIATPDRQKKEYRFSPIDRIGAAESDESSTGIACDQWDFKTSMEKWVVVVLTGYQFQHNDTLFVFREPEAGVTRVEQFGSDLQSSGFSSRGLLTLLWVRRNLLPLKTGHGASVELTGDRMLSFFFFTNDNSTAEDDNEEFVLTAAIVISVVTLAATAFSLLRAASWHRTFLPCWLCHRRRTMTRNDSSYFSVTPDGEHVCTVSTTGRTSRSPETLVLMEVEVSGQTATSSSGGTDVTNNSSNSNDDGDDDARQMYQSMLPPRYDQVIGLLPVVNFRRERRRRTRGETNVIPEVDEDVIEEDDNDVEYDAGDIAREELNRRLIFDLRNETGDSPSTQSSSSPTDVLPVTSRDTRATVSLSAIVPRNRQTFVSISCQQSNDTDDGYERSVEEEEDERSQRDEFLTASSGSPSSSSSSIAAYVTDANNTCLTATVPTQTVPTPLSSSSSSTSSSSTVSSTTLLRSSATSTPPTWRPRLQLLPRFQGTTAGSSGSPRHINPFEMRFSLVQEDESDDGVSTEEAPPPYYDESPPPSYNSLFYSNNPLQDSNNARSTSK